ncbi:Uncharacterized protein {ECO:0000313/EMBL:CCF09850.1} [Pantoea ananatis]|nr:Uncharacterized protein {ECO:0000313/EMBL:CCF09850.1} [Pantoea ananatis]
MASLTVLTLFSLAALRPRSSATVPDAYCLTVTQPVRAAPGVLKAF